MNRCLFFLSLFSSRISLALMILTTESFFDLRRSRSSQQPQPCRQGQESAERVVAGLRADAVAAATEGDMATTKFESLRVRLGEEYLYVHQHE